jgi:hypothetical protein
MSFPEGRKVVSSILEKALTNIPLGTANLLPNINGLLRQPVSQDQIDAIDNRYFDFEEQGDTESAMAAFLAARLMAAIRISQNATTSAELCEAAYEASFTLEQ